MELRQRRYVVVFECSPYFVVDNLILLFVTLIELNRGANVFSKRARKCWSARGMIGHMSAGSLKGVCEDC
jgi:hypothetical protein